MVAAPEIRYAKSDDLSIAYMAFGEGPDLVIAPGFISHLEVGLEEPSLAHFYARLATFRRVICFDKRGTGLSDPVPHAPTLEECVDDLRAVMKAAGSERADILGISEGGTMAALLAATHPADVNALVLYGACARILEAPDYPQGSTADAVARFNQVHEKGWGEGVALDLWAPSRRGDAQLRHWWARLQRLAASPGMIRNIFALYPQVDCRDVLPTIQARTLVIHRRGDRITNIGRGRYLAENIPGAKLVELDGDDHFFFTGDSDAILDEIEEFLTGLRRGPEPDRMLATVLFTDIVQSTAKAAQLGDDRWRELLVEHHALARRELGEFSGRLVDTTGDGIFGSFDGPARAVRCAHAIGGAVRRLGIEIRAGLHTGECEIVGNGLGGIAVHIGARIASLAGPGEVRVSSTVKDLVTGSGLRFVDRGTHRLKGVPEKWRLFAVAG